MKKISCLLTDIGGVLLTNGWDRHSRKKAAERFEIEYEEMENRHNISFGIYELGKFTLVEYLNKVVFYQFRPFSHDDFIEFMLAQSRAFPEMIELVRQIKLRHNLKVFAVSNEGRELTRFRIQKFKLDELIDGFVSSCFVHLKKPDPEIFQTALDITHKEPQEVIFLDDRLIFAETARNMGMHAIHHTDLLSTTKAFNEILNHADY